MNKCSRLISVLLLFIAIGFWLTACKSGAAEAEENDASSATAEFLHVVPSPTPPSVDELESVSPSLAPKQVAPTPATMTATQLAATALPPATARSFIPESTPRPTNPALIEHPVQPGETLIGIATRYGVSMAAIQLANRMGNSIDLMAGQTLSIPRSTQWLGENLFWIVHVVKQGETLVQLASTYGLTVDEILRVNAVADPALIHIDQQLVMPIEQLVALNVPQDTPIAIPAAATPAATEVQVAAAAVEVEDTSQSSELEATPVPVTPPTSAPPPGPPAGPAEWPQHVLARINQVRAENGLNPLNLVPELSSSAQSHAEDCAARGWGSHVGSDGAVLKTRLERVGYVSQRRGENWVQAPNADRAFDWWYGEIPPNDPHRRNILSSYYTEIGIGIAQTHSGYIFVTDFGRR